MDAVDGESVAVWVDAHLDAVFGTARGVLLDASRAEEATLSCFRHACGKAALDGSWAGRRHLIGVVLDQCRAMTPTRDDPRDRACLAARVAVAGVVHGGLSVDEASQASGLPAPVVTALLGVCREPSVTTE